jgi:hypothetical protein
LLLTSLLRSLLLQHLLVLLHLSWVLASRHGHVRRVLVHLLEFAFLLANVHLEFSHLLLVLLGPVLLRSKGRGQLLSTRRILCLLLLESLLKILL